MRTHWFALLTLLVTCAGCESATGPSPDLHGLAPIDVPAAVNVSAFVSRDATGARAVWLMFTNTASVADTIYYGACSFGAQLYSLEGPGRAVWDSRPAGETACIMVGYRLVLPAHGTGNVLASRITARAGGSPVPAAGTYRASALLNVAGRGRLVPAGQLELP